jgi:peroxiredoxin-like protein
MNNQLRYLYETEVEWTGEKRGVLRSPSLPSIEVSPPPEFNGLEGVWTPEHLFVAAVNSCFMTTFLAIAELSRLEFVSFDCQSTGLLEKQESGYQITAVTLRPRLVVRNHANVERVWRILDKAERNCLISKSIKTIVRVQPNVSFDGVEDAREELLAV